MINLDRRPDRLQKATQELQAMDIPFERVSGIDWPLYSVDALKTTHQCLIKDARDQGWDHIMIFEDDVHFINNTKEVILKALEELPSNWDMLYFGGNVDGPCKKVTPHLAKLSHCQSTHAYAIRYTQYERMESIDPGPIDLFYAHKIIPFCNALITIPMVAVQAPGYSDIEKREVNYETWMEERFWINLRRGK